MNLSPLHHIVKGLLVMDRPTGELVTDINLRLATINDLRDIASFLDEQLRDAGMGFVGSNQITTEIWKGTVWVIKDKNRVVGVRIGANTIYNLVVHREYRGQGLGRKLVEIYEPDRIRVKAIPVGHLSKKQHAEFIDPRPFYEKLGYKFVTWLKSKNFWAGQKGKKRIYYKESDSEHIALYENPKPRQKKLF